MTDANPIREDELLVLRSIFGDDWKDFPPTKSAWGTIIDEGSWEVVLRARDDYPVGIVIKGNFPKGYPKHVPTLSLSEAKGLSVEHVKQLQKVLQGAAKSKVGEAMVFEITELCQDWITENHLKLPNPNEIVPNLMEQKAQREQAQKDAEQAEIESERESLEAQAAEQNRLLTEKIQLDAERKSERARQAEQEADEKRKQESLAVLADGELEDRVLVLDEAVEVEGYQGSWRSWSLFGGKRDTMWTTYSAEPESSGSTSFVRASLPTVAVHVVDFSARNYSTNQGKKKVDALSNEVSRLRDVRCENVVRILAVKRGKSPKGWERLWIMTEFIAEGGKVKSWLPREGFGETLAREYLSQLLAGLSEIHRIKTNQKQIDTDHVLLCPGVGGDRVVKLCGTSFARRIGDLHLSNPFLRNYQDQIPELWKSPEEVESPHGYSPRRDIWQAALLFLQLIFGPSCLLVYPNLDILLQHSSISDPTVELLRAMMHPNPKKRVSADEAIDRLKQKYIDTSMSMTIGRSTSSSTAEALFSPPGILGQSPADGGRPGTYFPQSTKGPWRSRYREEFVEVEFLGKGGFGEVVKARHKLDSRVYAIKKVKLRHGDDEQKVYREVQNMSGVDHPHIVRYYNCWLEDVQPPPEPELVESGEESADTETPGSAAEEDIFKFDINDISFSRPENSRSASFPSVRFADDSGSEGQKKDREEDETSSSESSSASDSEDSDDSNGTIPDPSSRHRTPPRAITKPKPLPKPSMSTTDATSETHTVKTILYIAMEFVEKQTLRELISAGVPEEQGWGLLKQILDALAELGSRKIVHRDLKPSNILINTYNQVKIADFGLSTTDMTSADPSQIGSHDIDGEELDRTSNIGTGLYIAPEVAVSRSYDEKADMYSLGIILFEMCFKFNTQMERAQIIGALRTPSVTFPSTWEGMSDQRKIITSLLQHDPSLRPTAKQLLRDPLLPNPERDEQKYIEAVDEISAPSSKYYPHLVRALFDPDRRTYATASDNRLDDYTYDNPHDDDLQVWITVVQARLVQLFQRHGAVETHLPLFTPETSLLSAFRPPGKPAKLLDSSGKLVRLPASNLLGMARNATRRQIERIKRYHIGERYEAKFEGQPSVTGELSFDIISPIRSFAAEAEMIDLIDKILSEFKGGRNPAFGEYEIHISHEGVLATILGAIPEKQRGDVARLLRQTGSTWTTESKIQLNSLSGIPKPLRDDIDTCCLVDDFTIVKSKLENIFTTPSSRRRLLPALDEIDQVLKLARAAGVSRRIYFRPTMSRRADYFRGGIMFECIRHGKSRDLLAYGGRYDTLLQHFKDPAKEMTVPTRQVYGVGMSLALDLMASTVKVYESGISARLMNRDIELERSFGYWTPARCDVYIVAAGLDLAGRMGLTGELWRAGIGADMQYDDERSQIEVERECLDQNTLFLLVPKANRQSVKIRPILKKGSEVDVPRNELVSYLRQAILEQRRIDAGYALIDQSAGSSYAIATSCNEKSSHEADIKLVLPPEPNTAKGTKGRPARKHRHTTKPIYYEKAEEFASRVGTHLPIIAIDLDPSLIARLALTPNWVNEDEHWRTILGELKSSELRKYADLVRSAVKEAVLSGNGDGEGSSLNNSTTTVGSGVGGGGGGMIGEGDRSGNGWVWLFSVREGKGFLLQAR